MPQGNINERQRRRRNAAVEGPDNREEGAGIAEGAGRANDEGEGGQPRRRADCGLGQGFAANRGADDGSGDEIGDDEEDPEDDVCHSIIRSSD
jgi:hypothetical protein